MKMKGMSRFHLFLIELIIVILFFAFACASVLQVFSKSYQIANSTTALNGAMLAIQTAAETDRTKTLDGLNPSPDPCYFNKDWEEVSSKDADFILTTQVSFEDRWTGTMAIFHYKVVTDQEEMIFELQTKKYYSGESISSDPLSEVN